MKDVTTYDNMLAAEHHCELGKKNRSGTVDYHMDRDKYILQSIDDIIAGNYDMGKLYGFTIYEPKKREIIANEFPDKVIQRHISKNILEPTIMPKLIYDNYASQPGKGTKIALDRALHFMRSYINQCSHYTDEGFIFEGDIHHFFYTIARDICSRYVSELNIDDACKALIDKSIYVLEKFDGSDKGICIGLQSSQWLAVYYLNKLDHYIKEVLHVKYYGRYMDDFYIIMKDRKELEYVVKKIYQFVEKECNLQMNPKSNIHPFSQGLTFLGFRFVYNPATHDIEQLVRGKSVNRMVTRSKKLCSLVEQGKITVEDATNSLVSWNAYATQGETKKSKKEYKKAMDRIIGKNNRDLLLYRDWCYYNNMTDEFDEEGFFVLRPTENYRDKDHFTKLVPKKPRMKKIPKQKKPSKKQRRIKSKEIMAKATASMLYEIGNL